MSDYSRVRDGAFILLEQLKRAAEIAGEGPYGDPRKSARNVYHAFEELDKYFIAHAATNPAMACDVYNMLWLLIISSFVLGQTTGHHFEVSFKETEYRLRQIEAGKGRGEQMRADIKWALHAEELAREIKEENASVGAAGIASRILKRWKRTDIEKANREQLRGHIRRMNKAGTLPIRKD